MESANFKSGFATLIGRPNVGKSTLMNHLIGQKIAITSNKPQTTRNRIQTVYTSKQGQIVFLDTPGIHKAKNKLGEYMVSVAEQTLKEVDVVLWLVEPTDFIGKGERHIAEQLKKSKTPVILIMNKIDMADKEKLPEYMAHYRELYDFEDVIPVCALPVLFACTLLVRNDILTGLMGYILPFAGIHTICVISARIKSLKHITQKLLVVSASSYIIYLFHTTFEGFVKSLVQQVPLLANGNDPLYFSVGAAAVIGAGIFLPIILHRYILQRNRLLRFLFGLKPAK